MKNEYNSGEYIIQIFDKFQWFRCKHYQIVAGNVHSPPIFATNNIKESRNFVLIEKYFCQDYRECTGGIEVSPQKHSLIQTLREVKHLNIQVLSSQFINKILIFENNNFTQQFQKQKRPSMVVVMLSYYTAPVHNDMEDFEYY
ncbi:Hypothetical_protein [Hexamita inflata]|uniref:Hypothetical_protein n=1 Tax=Hexamita inflata TaxID=28002 RepID=A0AA86R3P9_9EUKA|nr:Hypothetical protein HINF_LOCUS57545 [Hexamita inflata]